MELDHSMKDGTRAGDSESQFQLAMNLTKLSVFVAVVGCSIAYCHKRH